MKQVEGLDCWPARPLGVSSIHVATISIPRGPFDTRRPADRPVSKGGAQCKKEQCRWVESVKRGMSSSSPRRAPGNAGLEVEIRSAESCIQNM